MMEIFTACGKVKFCILGFYTGKANNDGNFCSMWPGNRAYPENTNFETVIPRNLKFHTCGDLHTTKKC